MVRQRLAHLLVTWLVLLRTVARLLVSCARLRPRARKQRLTVRWPRLRALCAGCSNHSRVVLQRKLLLRLLLQGPHRRSPLHRLVGVHHVWRLSHLAHRHLRHPTCLRLLHEVGQG